MADQIPFNAPAFPDPTLVLNADPRCPVVLLVDTSGSMGGAPIQEVNQGLISLKDSLSADSLALKRVEIAIVTFGTNPVLVQDFVTPDRWNPQTLQVDGTTGMGSAISMGIQLVDDRKKQYRAAGTSYYRPWIFLITDGAPTDMWDHTPELVHKGEANKNFMFFAVGVGDGVDYTILKQIAPPSRPPMRLKGLGFRELFKWLSASLSSVSKSRTNEQAVLPQVGWGSTT